MFDYKPKPANIDPAVTNPDDIGWLQTEFEAFEPNPKFSFDGRGSVPNSQWKTIVPKHGPQKGDLPQVMKNLIKSTWKLTEPKAGAARGNILMGTRGTAQPILNPTYNPQVRPADSSAVYMNDATIANDWKLLETIERTNAVTFRADTRSPAKLIGAARGFFPPETRTDRFYLENGIYNEFNEYFRRRYKRQVDKADFLRAVDTKLPTPEDKNLLINYMTWRMLMDRESSHLGRMAANECLKGYISTARSLDSSINFAHMRGGGWIYLVIVHNGFVVPEFVRGANVQWATHEAEIAQWGPIPAERIVGFRQFPGYKPVGPIFIRRSFRKNEAKAFETMFNSFSGMKPV